MSRRAEYRRRTRERNVAVVAGWCAADTDLLHVRRATHDTLIDLMGDRRTGGVSWVQFTGPAALRQLVQMQQDAADPETAAHYDQIAELLTNRGGYLVIAFATGIPTPPLRSVQ